MHVVGQVANLPGQDSILPHKATVIHSPTLPPNPSLTIGRREKVER
jgi:hypothetical protein